MIDISIPRNELEDNSKLTPLPKHMAILEEHKRNQTEHRRRNTENQTRVLTTDIREELRREQRSHGAEGVPHQPLSRDRRATALAVAIAGVRVRALEHEIDPETDRRERDRRRDPRQVAVLREAVDEETDGQEGREQHGAVEAGLRQCLFLRIGGQFQVFRHLVVGVHDVAERDADAEADVRQAGDAFVPAALGAEGDGDDGQEQEDDEPAEADPEPEGEDHGLGREHVDRFYARRVQHVLDRRRLQITWRLIALVAGGVAQGFGALVQSHAATGLAEENGDEDEQRDVGQALHAFDPAPADGLVDEAGVDGRGDGAEDGDVAEQCHRARPLADVVHVAEGAADEDGADAAEEAQQCAHYEDRGDVLAECEADEAQREAGVGADVDHLAADKLAEGGQEERCYGAGHVEAEKTHFAEFGRCVEIGYHAVDTRAVGGGREADE